MIGKACISPAFCQLQRLLYCLRRLSLECCPRRSLLFTSLHWLLWASSFQTVLGAWLTYLFEQGPFKLKEALSGLMCLVAPSKASLAELFLSSYCEFRAPVVRVSLHIVATAIWCHSCSQWPWSQPTLTAL